MGMEVRPGRKIFRVRGRLRRMRAWASFFHLACIVALVGLALSLYPRSADSLIARNNRESREAELRQRLVEVLDTVMRYEHYYREVHGRFTRDLDRLGLPLESGAGRLAEVRRAYEISVLEIGGDRLTLLATGARQDRVTIDERHRVHANFILPPPSKYALYEEASRQIAARRAGRAVPEGVYTPYWRLERGEENGDFFYTAVGVRQPVLGERHSGLVIERTPSSLFSTVSEQLRSRLNPESRKPSAIGPGEQFTAEDVQLFLAEARQAMHVYKREKGVWAKRWEDLDAVTGFRFLERKAKAANVKISAVELEDAGYRITVDGISGDLLGEQFALDQSGTIRQVRYTEALIQQLEESTALLKSALRFQVSETKSEESGSFLDRQKTKNVESKK